MARLAVAPDYHSLIHLLREPDRLASLSPQELSRVLDAAEHARLLGWLMRHARDQGPGAAAPQWLKDRLVSAERVAAEDERAVRWETERLRRAFDGSDIRWVLLKGAGYLAADLPPGHGRRVADLDVLVAESELAHAEGVLRDHGWDIPKLDPYDERFYREWMHELPPMVHRERGSIVDLHHAILPRTSRLHADSGSILDRSIEVTSGVRVLCPSHMILHAAVHLFHDGEISGALRDLVDLDLLLRHFGEDSNFWPALTTEAVELGLTRPAYYALRYAHRILGTPIPADVVDASAKWAPPIGTRILMDFLVERTLQGRGTTGASVSAFALYVRSHWLRMPPLLLVRHLTRKALRSRS